METLTRVLKSVSNQLDIPFSLADLTRPDEPLIYVNQAFEQLTGYSAKEVVGRNCRFLQVPETNQESRRAIREAIEQRQSFWIDILNSKRDGTRFWNRLIMIPFGYNDEDIKVFIGIQMAVSEDRATIETKFSTERSENVRTQITAPIHKLIDIRRSLAYLQYCQDEEEYQQRLNEISLQMKQEVQNIINYLQV